MDLLKIKDFMEGVKVSKWLGSAMALLKIQGLVRYLGPYGMEFKFPNIKEVLWIC